MSTFDWRFRAKLFDVTDGDTVKLVLDMGFHIHHVVALRLAGINAPEIFSGTEESQREGHAARRAVFAWFVHHEVCGDRGEFPFTAETQKDRRSFNRYIGTVTCAEGHELVPYLIENGYGVPA